MLVFLFAALSPAAEKEPERTGGPYVPTPQIVVDQMLRLANVGPKDFVIDLGSGDGVIVLTAARQYKASGFGVDIDPVLVRQSNADAKRYGIEDRAAFYAQDVFKADLSKATVITLYLLPSMMINLRSKIYLEPRPGTRVVSHDYTFDDWQPDDQITLDVPEKEKITGVPRATILLWIVPAKVAGKWQVQVDSGEQYELTLRQTYQKVSATATARGNPLKVAYTGLRGEDITFAVGESATRRQFRGSVSGESMQGTVELGGGRTARWTAKRV
ncbi:MAG: SAM-dependent methyltransferase [Burkholderiales bacterium]